MIVIGIQYGGDHRCDHCAAKAVDKMPVLRLRAGQRFVEICEDCLSILAGIAKHADEIREVFEKPAGEAVN